MRSRLTAVLCAGLLTFTAASCGGGDDKSEELSGDDRKAVDALTKSMAGESPTDYQKKNARCVSEGLVKKAGVDKLVKVKLLTKDLKVAGTAPELTDRKLAGQYADAWIDCVDLDAQVDSLKGQYPDATKADFDNYIKCIEDIPESQLRDAVIESSIKDGDQAKVATYDKAATKCGRIIQPEPTTIDPGRGDGSGDSDKGTQKGTGKKGANKKGTGTGKKKAD